MSLELSRQADHNDPSRLQTNINSTCYGHVVELIRLLVAAGKDAALMAKTNGEGQYTPPGFDPQEVEGLDGKTYVATGVSHDALWCDGKQFDSVERGNDSPDPIFDSNGNRITGEAVWNEIPQQFWRPNNPPLRDVAPEPQPCVVPGYEEIGGDAFYRAEIGVPLEADMKLVGAPLNNGSSVWFSRTIYDIIVAHINKQQDQIPAIVKKHRNEWRAILGLPSA